MHTTVYYLFSLTVALKPLPQHHNLHPRSNRTSVLREIKIVVYHMKHQIVPTRELFTSKCGHICQHLKGLLVNNMDW